MTHSRLCQSCGLAGFKSKAGRCAVCGHTAKPESAVGSLHEIESQSDAPKPHSDVGSLHEVESQEPRKLSMSANPTEEVKALAPAMQSAFIPGAPQKMARGPHQASISHPVVTHTDGLPPHEKLVAGAGKASDGRTRDVNQPPIPGPPPMHPVTQSAFPPPEATRKDDERVQKEGTKAKDEKRAWISNKIKTIMKDGLNGKKPERDQAVAAAFSMWKQEHGK